MLNQCFYEMLNSANQAWTMYPGLSHGAYECLHAHGTPEQKATYLPKLTSGEWTGTMCLTEPHCGTDLGLLRTKAEPQADGSYRITGQKIFISRRRARPGRRTSSTWCWRACPTRRPAARASRCSWCPSSCVNADGTLGERNPIFCSALEHKMGIHGNATCQIDLDGAVGTLVGQPQQGPGGDVRDDERGAPGRGQPVRWA